MLLRYLNSNNEEVTVENELIINDFGKNEIRVYNQGNLIQVIPLIDTIKIIEFDETSKPLSDIDQLKISQAEQFEILLTLIGGM